MSRSSVVGVVLVHDARHAPVLVAHDPRIAVRLGELGGEQRRGAVAGSVALDERSEGRGPHQRRVAGKHDDVALVEVGVEGGGKARERDGNGVSGAPRRGLFDELDREVRGRLGLDGLGHLGRPVPDDDDDPLDGELGQRVEHVEHHRPSAQAVERLRRPRAHAGSLSRREHDGRQWATFHRPYCPLLGRHRQHSPIRKERRLLDFRSTQEQEMLRTAVGAIAAKYGHRYFQDKAATGGKTEELWQELGRAGFLSVHLPQAYGGGGMGIAELAIVCEEVAAAGCPLLMMLVSPAICGTLLSRYGTEEQRVRWLPPLAAGQDKMAFAITEPDAGSNSHRIATSARRDGDEWVLSGTKYFISGMDEAGAVLVVARTGTDESTGRAQLSLFVVDSDAPRLTLAPIEMEIRAPEKQFTLFFDEVAIGADRLLGDEGEGFRQVFAGLNPERLMSAAIATGIGRYALESAAGYARERRIWGTPIGAHQGVAHPLARAKIDLELARLMAEKAAWCFDHGLEAGEAANMAKFAAAEAALSALDQAIQTYGGNGLASETGLADLWGLARLMRTAPVSREMILNFVAQHSLELPKSY